MYTFYICFVRPFHLMSLMKMLLYYELQHLFFFVVEGEHIKLLLK